MASILIVEDEQTLRCSIVQGLEMEGHNVQGASCFKDAWELTRQGEYEAIVTDVNLVGDSGLELVRRLREEGFDGVVVVITAFGTIGGAVEAMKLGADEFLQKPIGLEELGLLVAKALENRKLRSRLRLYERLERVSGDPGQMIGDSPAWKRTLTLAERFAAVPIPRSGDRGEPPTILLLGETGTGKGVLARHMHARGSGAGAAGAPFVHVNCAALPASLIESELFGHERGAFTDAKTARTGLFELAEGGTIFLDEIGELSMEMQAKLLLVVERGVFRRIGGTRERTVRTRVIAATNQDLEARVQQGSFRRDLYYRLNGLTIQLPRLRDRGDDAVLLAEAVLERLPETPGRGRLRLEASARSAIGAHAWPGNVRELINLVRRAAIMCERDAIGAEELGLSPGPGPQPYMSATPPTEPFDPMSLVGGGRVPTIDEMERQLIIRALSQAKGNISMAAKLIGLNRGALRYRIERLGLDRHVHGMAVR